MDAVVIVSAGTEWRETKRIHSSRVPANAPVGEFIQVDLPVSADAWRIVILHGGWGKVPAAASAQYAIDRWHPALLVNLGTCGGIRGAAHPGEILLVDQTVAYDIEERMSDPEEAIARFSTELDLNWMDETKFSSLSELVRRATLVSGDRDLDPSTVRLLHEKYHAVAGDWESGAIAWVAARNRVRCLILRAVSDLVGPEGGQAYATHGDLFRQAVPSIMKRLFVLLPELLGTVKSCNK